MLSKDIDNLSISINEVADKVSPDVWQFLKQVKTNLEAAAESARTLENLPIYTEALGENHG